MKYRQYIAFTLVFIALACSACAVRQKGNSSSVDNISSEYDVHTLADRPADELSKRYGTYSSISIDKNNNGHFGFALEQSLLSRNFIVDNNANKKPIRYVVGVLQEANQGIPPIAFVQINMPDNSYFSFSDALQYSVEPMLPLASRSENTDIQEKDLFDDFSLPETQTNQNLPVASSTLPLSAPKELPQNNITQTKSYPVRKSASAEQIALRNGLSAQDFCTWNNVSANEKLAVGREVYLQKPVYLASNDENTPQSITVMPNAMPKTDYTAPVITENSLNELHADAKSITALPTLKPLLEEWEITAGSLRIQVMAWASRANYQLVWKASNDFIMESKATFKGQFLDVLAELFNGVQQSGGHSLKVTIYKGNKVVEVTED